MNYVYTIMSHPDGVVDSIFRYSKHAYDALIKQPRFNNQTTWIYDYPSSTWIEYSTDYIHRRERVISEEELQRIIVEMELIK